MADSNLTSLTQLTTPASGDWLYIVDISDTTDGALGTSKKILYSDLTSGFATSGANSNITSLTGLSTPLSIAQGGTGNVTAALARTALGLAIGTNVQAWDADLDAWALKTAPTGVVVGTTDSQTLTNKTLTTPIIASISNSGTITIPTGTDTLVGKATTDTLTNKTLTKPTINGSIHAVTAMGAQALDGSASDIFTRTLAASETFTQSNFTTGQVFMVEVKQGSGTSFTVTWFAGITWVTPGATAPVQTTVTNGITTYGFRCTGTNTFLGYLVGTQ